MKQYDVPELEDAELATLAAPAPDAAYVEVAAHAHVGGGRLATLTYAVPAYLRGRLGVGQLIWAPLRQKLVLGIVIAAHGEAPHFAAREIHAPVEPEFRLHPRQLALAAWIAERYCCTLFEAALPMLPPGASRRSVVHLVATGAPLPLAGLSPRARRLLTLLEERGETSLADAQAALGSSLATVVARLEQLGLVERVARVVHEVPRAREERYIRLLDAGLRAGDTVVDPARAPKQAAVLDLLRRQARIEGRGARAEGREERRAPSGERRIATDGPSPLALHPSP